MNQLGNRQMERRVTDNLAFPFGLSDVGIMSYDYGHEDDVFFSGAELSIHSDIQGVFWKCVL